MKEIVRRKVGRFERYFKVNEDDTLQMLSKEETKEELSKMNYFEQSHIKSLLDFHEMRAFTNGKVKEVRLISELVNGSIYIDRYYLAINRDSYIDAALDSATKKLGHEKGWDR